MIEALNQIARRNQAKRAVVTQDPRSRAAEAILRILGGTRSGAASGEDLSPILAAGNAADVFAPAERTMVQGVLGMAERPVRSIMTPATEVVWLNVGDAADALSRKIFRTGHAAYPVCRDKFVDLLGVARAPDLACDLLEKGRIDPATLEREPLTVREDGYILQMVEQVRGARVPIAIVNDPSGTITGVVTATDLLQVILGERRRPA